MKGIIISFWAFDESPRAPSGRLTATAQRLTWAGRRSSFILSYSAEEYFYQIII